MFTIPIGFWTPKTAAPSTDILVTLDMSTPSTAGFRLVFASGSLTMDWDDGGGDIPFVSAVELTKSYSTPGTKNCVIKGDFANITQFWADDSKITSIVNLQWTLVSNLRLHNNLLTSLDLGNAPITGTLFLFENSNLDSIAWATSGNGILTNTLLYGCAWTALDFTNIGVGGTLLIYNMQSLLSIIFATSGNSAFSSQLYIYGNRVSNIDFSNIPASSGLTIRLFNNDFSATEHDDQIINFAATDWGANNLAITGGNAARTSASDVAYNALIADGWTIT